MSIVASKKLLVDILEAGIAEKLPEKQRVKVVTPKMFSKHVPTDPVGELAIFYQSGAYKDKSRATEMMNLSRGKKFVVYIIIKESAELEPEAYVDLVIDTLTGIEVSNANEEKFITIESDQFIDETDDDYIVFQAVFNVPERIIKRA